MVKQASDFLITNLTKTSATLCLALAGISTWVVLQMQTDLGSMMQLQWEMRDSDLRMQKDIELLELRLKSVENRLGENLRITPEEIRDKIGNHRK